jgi:prepilin-type N-terminal cleavage/methylation domain-containing protein
MKRCDATAGFTLLELIISLTIIAIIAMLVQNGFKLSVNTWEKGEAAIEDQQQYRVVLELIRRQLSSSLPNTSSERVKIHPDVFFKGDDASLEFISRMSLIPGDSSGRIRVRYRVEMEDDRKSVSFVESGLIDRLRVSSQDEPGEEDWHVLLSDIRDFTFEYLTRFPPEDDLDDSSFWESSWGESDKQKRFPLALRIRFQANEESSPLYLMVPIGKGK